MAKSQTKAATNGTPKAGEEAASLPCYALSLTVKNVRSFGPEQTLDLSDGEGRPAQWTIILGENGTGKTTLLQAIVCLELMSFSNIADRDRLSTLGSQQLRGNNSFINVLHGFPDTDPLELTRNNNDITNVECYMSWVGQLTLRSLGLTNGNTFWKLDLEGTLVATTCERPPSSLIFFAYGAGRRLGDVSLRQNSLDDPVGTLFDENALLRNAEEWLLQLDYAASKKSDIQAHQVVQLERVKSLLISILTDDIEDIRFSTTGGVYPKARVEFQTFSGWVPLRRLGYGYQTLIAWVTDFASRMMERYPDSPDPFKEAAIVLVDEIDLHLHPLWQRKLIADLSKHFPNTQFIATAHSPLVVQAAENANIAVLKRVGDHVEIVNDPEQIRGWRIDQILTSDLFGLPSARSPEVEALFERKQELLNKPKTSAREKAELREIQQKIDKLPVGDSAHAVKEMETIREAIDVLKDQLPK